MALNRSTYSIAKLNESIFKLSDFPTIPYTHCQSSSSSRKLKYNESQSEGTALELPRSLEKHFVYVNSQGMLPSEYSRLKGIPIGSYPNVVQMLLILKI